MASEALHAAHSTAVAGEGSGDAKLGVGRRPPWWAGCRELPGFPSKLGFHEVALGLPPDHPRATVPELTPGTVPLH